jgi:hypothetical protein
MMLKGWRKLERELPSRARLLEKTSVRVDGHRRSENGVETTRTCNRFHRLADWSIFQIDIPPVVYIPPP